MASDKVIIFFAKHNNIGPFVVGKDVLKNIEKILKNIQNQKTTSVIDAQTMLAEKKQIMLRFYNLL